VVNDAGVLIERSGENLLGVRSDLTFTTVTAVLAQSQSLLHEGSTRVVIDLADVTRADSAGLALLMQWLRIGQKLGKDIRFRHLPEQLLAIARASDLDRLIPLED
jgi:phospholipid transport system transporter-binding protein